MSRLEITLLGSCAVSLGPGTSVRIQLPTRKSLALLAYLSMSAWQPCSREVLSALLWGDVPDSKARHSLRQTLLVIRAALEPHGIDVLRTVGDSVSLDPAGLRVDARLFERLLERGTPESIRVGVCLYRGDFLEGLNVGEPAFDLWATTRRIHLRQRAIEALEGALEHLTLKGRVHEAIHCALDLLAIDPLLESAHRALIRLYANSGQVGAALRQYDTCARDLEAELHVSPEAETVNLVREIRSRGRAHAGIPVTPVLTQSRRTRHPQRG